MEKGLSLAYYVNRRSCGAQPLREGPRRPPIWWSLVWSAAGLQIAFGLFYFSVLFICEGRLEIVLPVVTTLSHNLWR